ncbi:MAG TPA: YfcE family phosphodiesterase [Clostridia bacterium]|nr:YfcE family phosphodiesterase [Clostridia bacterium]
MKIVVFADSHTDVSTMLDVVRAERPDVVLHLGDHLADGLELQNRVDIAVHLVKGNTDQADEGKTDALLEIEHVRVWMTHGHLFKVENGLTTLYDGGARAGAQIVLFGHTHRPHLSYRDGIWLMNPGRVGRISSKAIHATYGVIRLADRTIRCAISEVPSCGGCL